MSLPFALGALRVGAPLVLLALAALPLFFLPLGARRTRATAGAAACRAGAAAALVLTLAGLQLERPKPAAGTCIVAAIDVSASVREGGIATAAAFLSELVPALGPQDVIGSLAFAGRAHVVRRPQPPPRDPAALLPPSAAGVTGVEAGDTDIAHALVSAAPLCPEGRQSALVLVTDGNETAGSLLAEAALTEPAMPVFPIVPAAGALPPALVRRVLAPALAPEHSVLPLEVVVESRAATPLRAALHLSANGEPLAREPVDLPPGLSVIALPYRLRGAGHYLLETELVLPGAPAAPGPTRTALTVTRPLQVLVVSERELPVVARALGARGTRVEMLRPDRLPARSRRLDDVHVVVLDDVARARLDAEALDRVAAFVARGGGLVVTGGRHLFGDSGYAGSPLARVLPVELQSQSPEPREREPIALYLVIDRSNSMGYASREPAERHAEKMIYAKRAARAVLDQLGPRDLVGAIVFDSRPYELGPLCAGDACRAALAARIAQVQHGGGTDFKEALDIARRNLIESGRSVRHVILLTDGDTNRGPEDHAGLIAALARAEITVTTIRVGTDAINVDLLAAIARATGGEFHRVPDARALPKLMIRDARRLTRDPAAPRTLPVRIGTPGSVLAGLAEGELPAVSRWAFTRARRGAEVRLYVPMGEERDPLLATWQYELGRVAALPLDFQAGAAAWAGWDGFGTLWAQLVAWAAPTGLASDRHVEVERRAEGTLIRVRTLVDGEGPFALHLPSAGDVRLRRTGARVFTATVPGLASGVHQAVLLSERAGALVEAPLTLVVPATATSDREHRVTRPNRDLLAAVASLTGGVLDPAPDTVLAVRPGFAREVLGLDWLLVPLALVLVLADVALRRLAR